MIVIEGLFKVYCDHGNHSQYPVHPGNTVFVLAQGAGAPLFDRRLVCVYYRRALGLGFNPQHQDQEPAAREAAAGLIGGISMCDDDRGFDQDGPEGVDADDDQ